MKKMVKSVAIILLIIICISLIIFSGFLTESIRLPSDLTQSAQSAETAYAQITAEMEAIDVELTKMASEPELTSIPSPSVTSQNWLEKFLDNPTCQIPCWENITPNETKIDTAIRIVSQIPGTRILAFDSKGVGWYFNNMSSTMGHIVANQQGIVIQIVLRPGFDKVLSEVINSYGPPDSIKAIWDCQYVLSYRYQGMLLITRNTSCKPEAVDISLNTQLYEIILFPPDNQNYTLDIFLFNIDEIPWDGYKSYDFTDP